MHYLRQVQTVTIGLDGRRFRIRTDLRPLATRAFEAVGFRPPSRMVELWCHKSKPKSISVY
jgi:hypothetical protein